MQIALANETLHALPGRALHWPRAATLFVADLHWGKGATLRAGGLPVPQGDDADLDRLSVLLHTTAATRLVILGDLLHARAGRTESTVAALGRWRAHHPDLNMLLVRGNHDARAGDPPADLGIVCVDEPYVLDPFVLRHTPQPDPRGYVLAGHLHPAVVLSGRGRQRLKLPCFWCGAQVAVLPAFSELAAGAVVVPVRGDRVLAIAGDEVVAVEAGGHRP